MVFISLHEHENMEANTRTVCLVFLWKKLIKNIKDL